MSEAPEQDAGPDTAQQAHHAQDAQEAQEAQEAQARLAAWRRDSAWRMDPARFHRLEALARRLPQQPPAVRQRLQAVLAQGLADYAERLAHARQTCTEEAQPLAARQPTLLRQLRGVQTMGDVRGLRRLAARASVARDCAPLAQLNQHATAASPTLQGAQADTVPGREELSNVQRFRRSWGRKRSQDLLAQARARKPVNAGPLNSHALVLDTLALVQACSPEYLRHLLAQVQALQWLDDARQALMAEPAKAAKAGKAAKTAKTGKGSKTAQAEKAEKPDKPARRRAAGTS